MRCSGEVEKAYNVRSLKLVDAKIKYVVREKWRDLVILYTSVYKSMKFD